MVLKRCFPPVVDAQTRVLVLGSLPGEASLAQNQYYAHKQNHFWRLMGEVIELDLTRLDYAQRLAALQKRGVGLWDVVAQARRKGSLDSEIRDQECNDLQGLVATLPQLQLIAFNGATAAKIGMQALGQPLPFASLQLPSSSPAYTLPFIDKSAVWQALRHWLI